MAMDDGECGGEENVLNGRKEGGGERKESKGERRRRIYGADISVGTGRCCRKQKWVREGVAVGQWVNRVKMAIQTSIHLLLHPSNRAARQTTTHS